MLGPAFWWLNCLLTGSGPDTDSMTLSCPFPLVITSDWCTLRILQPLLCRLICQFGVTLRLSLSMQNNAQGSHSKSMILQFCAKCVRYIRSGVVQMLKEICCPLSSWRDQSRNALVSLWRCNKETSAIWFLRKGKYFVQFSFDARWNHLPKIKYKWTD